MKHAEGVDPDEFSSDDSDDSLLLEEDIMLIEKALYEDEDDEIEQQNIAADPQRWECVSTLYGHKAAVTSVAFSNVGGELLPSVYPARYALPPRSLSDDTLGKPGPVSLPGRPFRRALVSSLVLARSCWRVPSLIRRPFSFTLCTWCLFVHVVLCVCMRGLPARKPRLKRKPQQLWLISVMLQLEFA